MSEVEQRASVAPVEVRRCECVEKHRNKTIMMAK